MAKDDIDLYAKPLLDMSAELQDIYEHFNRRLFDFRLPNCMITLKHYSGTGGYFSIGSYDRKDGKRSDEIVLNPALYQPEKPHDFLALLVHQMEHIDQHHSGKAGRSVYHNREFADAMIKMGLKPTSNGLEDGRETGDTIHQIIIPGGEFERAANELTYKRNVLTWTDRNKPDSARSVQRNDLAENLGAGFENCKPSSKSGKRVKYVCRIEGCKVKGYSSHDIEMICNAHKTILKAVSA